MAALDWLPTELFPPLFMAAAAGGHNDVVKAMVVHWPFIRLPLGALLESGHSHPDIFKAALDGFDILLARKVPPRRCKLRVLDLRQNTGTNFWKMWAGSQSIASVTSPEDAASTQARTVIPKRENSRAGEGPHPSASMALLTDLCFLETISDELLAFLNERVGQGKVLPPLLCRKLEFVSLSELPIIEEVLNAVQPDSVQEVGVHCGWDLSSLQWFLPHLFQMGHLSTLHLSRISLDPLRTPSSFKMEKILRKLASFLLRLHQLQHLVMEYVFFVNDQLGQLLRCVPTRLEALALKNCLPLDSDMSSLCLCPCTSQLRSLDLSGIFMARLNHGFLPSLLERVSATLTHLNLDDCGMNDSGLTALQPALGQCSQLSTLLLGGNRASMAVLQGLLQHSLPLCKFSLLGLPVPQDCYDHPQGPVRQDALAEVMQELRVTLQAYRPLSVRFVPSTRHRAWDEVLIHMDR
ncbi:melanoma antigen preferentially expressed in tumors-like [Tenrec ecaudatus]|uniref:melanoma antigen preferentially expressed in tumors-like n=1 Tax=Tenrec ecaudatus TaxID=94439 RepID=UPI003F594F34